jgi:NAD(P)H-dependent flavin oxidoreductase YrpB (nitropropane dioxygenase family)
MAFKIDPIIIGGKELHPIIEGGKGVGVSTGATAGAFAASGAIGTFSGVNADYYDEYGNIVPVTYHGKTRKERHEELVDAGIKGGIAQARIARDISNGAGRIHMNVLWEMGGAERILQGVLEGAKGLINGITCGAGMPYRVAEIAAKFNVEYFPIISSMRAFRALWKRSYHRYPELLGGVVYEDPWLAGGHNGLSNVEDPNVPQDPYPRIAELRTYMNEVGLNDTPIIMAGGVWYLRDWSNWFNNPEIGKIAFQFGTRPIVTKESPVSDEWKYKLLSLKEGDVFLNRFSPTGFYSSAVRNEFINELHHRNLRQIPYLAAPEGELTESLQVGARGRPIYIKKSDKLLAEQWITQGFTETLKTPESTVIFVTETKAHEIHKDQIDCMGCLSACKFSNWADHDNYNTGKRADPRSFCIQKTLQDIIRGIDINHQLMFSGHNAYKFASDPFYKDNYIPTIKELVDRILAGN